MAYTDEEREDITKQLCKFIKSSKGSVRKKATKKVGISYDTFREWWEKHPEFSESIKKAESESRQKGKEYAISMIFKNMAKSWYAGAWWLERNFPDEFGAKGNEDDSKGPFEIKHSVVKTDL